MRYRCEGRQRITRILPATLLAPVWDWGRVRGAEQLLRHICLLGY